MADAVEYKMVQFNPAARDVNETEAEAFLKVLNAAENGGDGWEFDSFYDSSDGSTRWIMFRRRS
jgi:hypothetical protein